MAPDFKVRRETSVLRAAALHAFTQDIFRPLPIDPPSSVLKETIEDFARRISTDACFVAESGNVLVGSVFGTRKDDTLYFGRLAVHIGWRRKGVASALIAEIVSEARRVGAQSVTAGVRIVLASNVALMRRHGFAVVGQSYHYGPETPTAYDMELRLT